ncbi:MAG: tetratricopeptide repeat protein, partial [Candidatus Methanospirareceae archaeon]
AEENISEALKWAEKSKQPNTIAHIKCNVGYIQYRQRKYKEALRTLNEALKEAEKTEDTTIISRINEVKSLVLKELGRSREARELNIHLVYTPTGFILFTVLTLFFLCLSLLNFYIGFTTIGIASLGPAMASSVAVIAYMVRRKWEK